IVDRGEGLLHLRDVGADSYAPAEARLHIWRRCQVIGMSVCLQHPRGAPAFLLHGLNQPVNAGRAGAAGLDVEIEHGIDDGADAAALIRHDVAVALGGCVEETEDGWPCHERRLLPVCSPVALSYPRTLRKAR